MRLYSIALLLSAAAFLLGGIELMAVGGSWFYAITGAALVVSAVLVWRGRRLGSWLIGALFAATLGWALWESGFDAWALLPRVWFIAVLGAWLVILEWRRRPPPRAPRRPPGLATLASAAVAVLALAAIGVDRTGPARSEAMSPTTAAPPAGAGDWMTFGRTPGGTRFSPLGDITPANVGGLRVAWTYRVGEADPHGFEATPLKVADSVYLCTGGNLVVALDAETGAERWRFDPRTQAIGPCRGVAYYRVPAATGVCAERIFSNVFDGRLIALDARTGERCAGFGRNGEIALTDGMRPMGPKQFMITSVPTVARGRVVVGGTAVAVKGFDEPSGVIRAFDAVTGALAWAYDAGQPERTGEPGQGTFYTVGMPNSWSQMAYDDVLGLVYVPTATGGASYYGAQRRPVDDEISTAIMALDVTTGRRRWLYQFVHHDLWDYDVAAQPLLVDVQRGGQSVKALVQTTKMGETFVLDRATGVPIDPVAERPVPRHGAVPEERLSPTQPFPTRMPSLSGGRLTEARMWGLSPFDQMWCRIKFREARYDGLMTPPGTTPVIEYPGWLGGMDWGGAAVDTDHGVMVVVTNYVANYVRMARLDPPGAKGPAKPLERNDLAAYALQADVPYANSTLPFLSPLAVPCQQPPWSRLTAVDLIHDRVLWSTPLGTGRDNGPLGIASHLPLTIGVPALGGTLVTGSGLTFVGASTDRTFRAFATATGKLLWQADLPAAGIGSPISYRSPRGRQIILTPAGGHKILGGPRADSIIAYALPGDSAARPSARP